MKLIIEIKDKQDENSPEPWSFYGAYDERFNNLDKEMKELLDYLDAYKTVTDIRIKVVRS